jgi:murein DD-endopeptidase MepM/ murein hydrolase activator NlpD
MVRWNRERAVPAALAALLLTAAAYAAAGPGPLPLEIRVLSRETAPGEPVRIVASAGVPLRSLEGTFLNQRLYFSPTDGGALTAWAVIGLDRRGGPAVLELRGFTKGGLEVAGTRAVTIHEKRFPEEVLKVEPKYVEPPPDVKERLARERRKLAGIYESRRPETPRQGPFLRPVPGGPTSTYGTRRLFNGVPKSPHPGLDLRAATGTPVKAAGAGEVVLAEDLYYSGGTVILDHGGGLVTLYAHLSRIDVTVGGSVKAGEQVGLSGATGRVTGPHLHWGAKVGNRHFDPTALLDPALFETGGS